MAGQVVVYDLRQTGTPLASIYVQGDVKSLRFSPPPKNKNTPNATTPGTLGKAPQSNAEQKEIEDLRRDLEQATSFNAHPSNHQYQQPSMQQPQKQSGLFSAPQHSNHHPHPHHLSAENSYQGSPQKSLAQQSESSTYGEEGSLQAVPLSYGSPTKQPQTALEYMRPLPQVPSQQQQQHPAHSGIQGDDIPEKGGGTSRPISHPAPTQQLNVEEIRDVVRDEVEKLQDHLEESLRNLHTDMIRQFHQQSQELNAALSSQMAAMDQLREENQRLREENDFLKRHQQQQNPPHGRR